MFYIMIYDNKDHAFQEKHHHHPSHKHDHPHGRRGHRRHGLHSARKLSSSELQLLLLFLLSRQPSHGYELIKSLEERSDGFYAPSPGMVYPALTYLEEIGYASVEVEGAKKRYQLTKNGQAYLQENKETAEDTLAELERIGARMAEARRAFEEDEGFSEELTSARRSLRRAMRAQMPCTADNAKRIAAILEKAAAQISKLK